MLHDGELTYAVCGPLGKGPFGAGLAETFLAISDALTSALRSLGVDAVLESGRPGGLPGDRAGSAAPCLVSVSRYEIAARGRKIAGSAQRRTRTAFLQHGSILLRPASERIVEYARGDWRFFKGRITNIAGERGGAVDEREVRSALVDAFATRFSVRWQPLELSCGDAEEIARRAREKRSEFSHLTGTEVVD